jgi:ferredoxin/flavodoxin
MNASVYYLSGTGNSLAIAKEIAKALSCEYFPVINLPREGENSAISTIIVVFPVYLAQGYGLPIIVKDCFEKIKTGEKTIVSICTCGGFKLVNAVPALCNLRKIVKARGLGGFDGYSIKLPMNNLEYPTPLISQDRRKMFSDSRRAIEGIYKNIIEGRHSNKFILQMVFTFLMKPLYALLGSIYAAHVYKVARLPKKHAETYFDAVRLTDRSIEVDSACTGCGVCAKVCPVDNIELKDGRPIFLHRCEMCTACDEWCPHNAIHHWCRIKRLKYHHPEISISDMVVSGS